MASVSVVIPSWNRKEMLARLLERLCRQSLRPAEIVVVDNGSSDGAAQTAEAGGARVVRMGHNTGFARAVNAGIAAAAGEWIAIVNNDVEPEPQWLERLAGAFSDPEVWFAAGKLVSAANPSRLDGSFDLISRAACAWRAGQGKADGPAFAEPRAIRMAPMTATLYRAELFRRVGTLDETFESYLEDVDFSLRCAAAGLAGRYVPDAVARHAGSATRGRWHADTVRQVARNQVLLAAKHVPPDLRRRWQWPLWVGQVLWGLVAARHGCFGAWVKGRREGLRRAPELRTAGSPGFESMVLSSEREIRVLQKALGWDLYWRVYFLLSAGELN